MMEFYSSLTKSRFTIWSFIMVPNLAPKMYFSGFIFYQTSSAIICLQIKLFLLFILWDCNVNNSFFVNFLTFNHYQNIQFSESSYKNILWMKQLINLVTFDKVFDLIKKTLKYIKDQNKSNIIFHHILWK